MNIILIVLGLIFTIGEVFISEKIDYISLILTILLILCLLKDVRKYFDLKKNGTLLKNLAYTLQNISETEKVLVIDYTFPNGDVKRFVKRCKDLSKISESGTTNILVDMKNSNNYYIFMP